MADLFDRLFPSENGVASIAIHYLSAALVDYATGNITRAQIIAYRNLDAEAEADLDKLCDAIDALSDKTDKLAFGAELHAVLNFAEAGVKYNTKATFKTRLGL